LRRDELVFANGLVLVGALEREAQKLGAAVLHDCVPPSVELLVGFLSGDLAVDLVLLTLRQGSSKSLRSL
jgi:hypothetical protein